MSREGTSRKHDSNEAQIVEFKLGGQSFGLSLSKVREFVPYNTDKITSLPRAPSHVPGVLMLRGQTLPLLDLRAYLGITPNKKGSSTVVVVSEHHRRLNGLITDGITKILRLPRGRFQPVHDFLVGSRAQMLGSISADGKEIFVLDLESILGDRGDSDVDQTPFGEDTSRKDARGRIKLFIAEDSRVMQQQLLRRLQGYGYTQVEAFSNGQETWEALTAMADRD